MNALLEQLRVHHIGIACHHIANELPLFQTLGFQVEDSFSDEAQGVKGVFITHHLSPYRLELLENLPEATTLNSYLKARIKCYHIAFESKDIHRDTELILNAHNSNQAQQKDKNYFNGGGGYNE
ncbi:VOC family protein [Helicobacter marmotae]|uniref:VOC family protein n=1 Tax=Helicobacter marmotae TaxID=152490 RepID=UPI001F3D0ADC|nr:VOC family protein [Helicobacter marmotae]